MNDDLISRQAAITLPIMPKKYRKYQSMDCDDAYEQGWGDCQSCIGRLPTADFSEYCDKLWKTAYERGTAERHHKLTEADKECLRRVMEEAELTLYPAEIIIHCKECVYYENDTYGLCDLGGEWAPDDYCSYGRRPKHG